MGAGWPLNSQPPYNVPSFCDMSGSVIVRGGSGEGRLGSPTAPPISTGRPSGWWLHLSGPQLCIIWDRNSTW